tara:strand:- start:38107 stop:38334 length:228 start_codon:yes stop_codon:yes gene_type:complete
MLSPAAVASAGGRPRRLLKSVPQKMPPGVTMGPKIRSANPLVKCFHCGDEDEGANSVGPLILATVMTELKRKKYL